MNEIPEELLQRLSAYMDGQGDADERAAVENELRSQPIAAQILQIWRDQSRELKAVSRQAASTKLPNGFADRVVDMAIETARQEGCNDNHPLILAGQSVCHTDAELLTARRSRTRRRVMAVAAIAASVVAMGWLGMSGILEEPSPNALTGEIAFSDPAIPAEFGSLEGDLADPSSLVAEEIDAVSSSAIKPQTPKPQTPSTHAIANVVREDSDVSAVVTENAKAEPQIAAVESMTSPSSLDESASLESAMILSPNPDKSLSVSLGVLLVVEVKCVDGVDRDGLMREAIQWAGIDANAEHEISEDMVTVADDVVVSEDPFQMIFLNAPARRLDRLHLRLASDKDRVESVGLTLADDIRLMKLNDSINQDPSLIRDTAIAVQISGESGMIGLADAIESLTFLPITDGDVSLGGQSMTASGPDELAQILFIVR